MEGFRHLASLVKFYGWLLAYITFHPGYAVHGFTWPILSTATLTGAGANDVVPESGVISTKDVVSNVAVAGATGRCGKLVVEELLSRGVPVVALVRDVEKAGEIFEKESADMLTFRTCDFGDDDEVQSVMSSLGCDAVIWCATGFSDSPGESVWSKAKKLLSIAVTPRRSIDLIGVPALADYFRDTTTVVANGEDFVGGVNGDSGSRITPPRFPKVVMLSSAGVTRPQWSEEKKAMFPGSAEIPIVRLNPFGILDIKAESEERLRSSGADYCIVRPSGLNDNWPSGSRPVLSQGDVAAGRINRKDVARLLVDVLSESEATGKTFEAIGLAGYPPAESLTPALSRLALDTADPPSASQVAATYAAMQQLLPGERQDSAGIALGQTYEQLDKNEEGPMGKRGAESLAGVPLRPSS